jgi:hypothetical protein
MWGRGDIRQQLLLEIREVVVGDLDDDLLLALRLQYGVEDSPFSPTRDESLLLPGETVQLVEHRRPQGRFPHERTERFAYPLRARREWADEKLRVPVEAGVRPPLVDGLIDALVPVEPERLFGEEIDIVEHLQLRSGRVDHVERSNLVLGKVYVVVEGQAITGPGVDLHELDVRVSLVLDVGDVVVEALVD